MNLNSKKGDTMFVIKPIKDADWQHALFMISYYQVDLTVRSNGEDANTTYMVVEHDPSTTGTVHENDLRTAEACFMLNWHQHGSSLCPECIDYSDRFDSCGHLAFSKPINPAF